VGRFRYPVQIADARGETFALQEPWVDSRVLYSQFPGDFLRRLGYSPNATRRLRLGDGSVIERPIGDILVHISGHTFVTLCVFTEDDSEAILGRLTLDAFGLAADASAKNLVSAEPMPLLAVA
jgi:hypothetical protein